MLVSLYYFAAVLGIKALILFFALNLKALTFLGVNEDLKFHTLFLFKKNCIQRLTFCCRQQAKRFGSYYQVRTQSHILKMYVLNV